MINTFTTSLLTVLSLLPNTAAVDLMELFGDDYVEPTSFPEFEHSPKPVTKIVKARTMGEFDNLKNEVGDEKPYSVFFYMAAGFLFVIQLGFVYVLLRCCLNRCSRRREEKLLN